MQGKDEITKMLASQLTYVSPLALQLDPEEIIEDDGTSQSAWFRFETALAHGYGHIRVREGRIWTLLTTIAELKGHPEMIGTRRPAGVSHGARKATAEAGWSNARLNSALLESKSSPMFLSLAVARVV